VYIEGYDFGAAANLDGFYSFTVPANIATGQEVTLTARFMGYRSMFETITLSPGTITQDFTLDTDVLMLDAVVVTGMGVGIEKEKLGVTIAKVSDNEIVNSDEGNVISSLHGKVANVEITAASGEPGAEGYIRIRGVTTIEGDNQPLIVVDGTPINNQSIAGQGGRTAGTTNQNRASDLNPDDIESMEILKGAAASAIYGSRAASGVVLITTKKGKVGKPKVSYKVAYSIDKVNKVPDLQQRYGQGYNGVASTTTSLSWGPEITGETYDHAWEMFETGHIFENNLTISGGNEWTTYYLSLERYDHDGTIVGNSDYVRNTVRLKASQRITESINITGNISVADISANQIQRGSNVSGLLLGAWRTTPSFNNLPYLDPTSGLHRSYRYQNPTVLRTSRGYDNPFFLVYEGVNTQDVGRFYGNLTLEWDPLDWLNVTWVGGHDYTSDQRRQVFPISSSSLPDGGVDRRKYNFTTSDSRLTVSATRRFKPADMVLNVLVGHQLSQRKHSEFTVVGNNMSVYGFNQVDNTTTYNPNEFEWTIRDESYFGQIMIDLFDQIYLSGSVRNDGSSTFGEAEKRHWYPKVSGAWEFTKLGLFSDMGNILSFGKIRAAWGVTGRQPGVYDTISAFGAGDFGEGWGVILSSTYMGYGGFFTSLQKGNADIKPERTSEYEIGAELAFWNNRIGVDFTYYKSKSTDVILGSPVAPSTGYGSITANAAIIENEGFEVSLDVQPINMRNFKWDLRAVWGTNDNMVVSLAGAERIGIGGFASCANYAVEGHGFGALWGEDFVRFGRGEIVDGTDIDATYTGWSEGDFYIAADGYPALSSEQRVIGDPNPDWTGSVRNTFTLFNKVTLSVLVDIKQGGDVWNGTRGALNYFGTTAETAANRGGTRVFEGIGPGAGTAVADGQSWYIDNIGSGFTGPAAWVIEDGSYIKLREISVAYKFKHPTLTKYTGLSDIDIRVSGRNLWTKTDYTGVDPETNLYGAHQSQGLDYFNNPNTKSYLVTLKFNY
jgi:TonB-linked SusC/RagA family outer membrane protein